MNTKIRPSKRTSQRRQPRKLPACNLICERLEQRTLLAITLNGVPDWIEQGPGPITGGQVEGLGDQDDPVAGAIEAIAAHPFDANILYAGTVNGGIWRTFTANFPNDGVDNDGDGDMDEGDENPIWYPLTDDLPSLAVGAVAFSPLDNTNNTLFAGTGDFRSGSSAASGGRAIGVLKTTDGGDTWDIVGPELVGFRIRSLVPTLIGTPETQVVLVAAMNNGGVFRSSDGGHSFTQISGTTAPTDTIDNDGDGVTDEPGEADGIDNDADGFIDEPNELTLPPGSASHLVADPSNPNRFYAAIPGSGVFRSDNGGLGWQPVNNGLANAQIAPATAQRIELAVSPIGPNPVYAALISQLAGAQGQTLNGLFRSLDFGANWTALDLPQTNEAGNPVGLHPNPKPGQQGGIHFSMLADSNNANIVFVGGDRQPGGFPNSIGCDDFSGRHFRGNAALAPGTQFAPINCDNASGTSPHADSRDMVFDANRNIIESDDGGIYRLVNPNTTNRRWVSLNGNIRVTEFYSVAYDSVNHAIIGGAQDVGVSEQNGAQNFTWRAQTKADGGFVAVATDPAGQDAVRYFSTQNLGGFSRAEFDNENNETDQTAVELNVVGTGNNLFGLEYATGGCGPPPTTGTLQFIQPYVLNNVFSDQMLIGTNYLYEAVAAGDQVTALGGVQSLNTDATDNDCDGTVDENDEYGPLNPVGTVTAMVYGGRSGGEDDGDLIYFGTTGAAVNGIFGNLFLRTTNSTDSLADFVTLTNYPGSTPQDIALDPDDWRRGYIIDSNDRVFRFSNAGAAAADWMDITTNLSRLSSNLQTIEVYRSTAAPDDEVVLVGGNRGVFRSLNPFAGASTQWTEFGWNLPNAVASDLEYVKRFDPLNPTNPANDVLLVGTLGRGAWTIPHASTEIPTPGDLTIDGTNFDDTIRLTLDERNPLLLDVFLNNHTPEPNRSIPVSSILTIHVNGLAGDDTLIVDFGNGNAIPLQGLTFTGGVGTEDAVTILGTDDDETYTVDTAGDITGVRIESMAMNHVAAMSLEAESIDIQAANGSDTVDVEGTPASLDLLTINGGGSSDTFNISPQAKNLDALDGNIRLETGGGVDRLNINDQNNPDDSTFTLTSTTLDRTDFPLLTYLGFLHLDIHTGSGDNIIDIESTFLAHNSIAAGAGQDTFNVSLNELMGELTIDGEADRDQMSIMDQANDSQTYTFTNDSLSTGWIVGQFEFSSIDSITLTTSNHANSFNVNSTSYDLTINAGAEDDTFYVSGQSDLLDDIQGNLTIAGGDGSDSLTVHDEANDSDHNYVIQTGSLARSERVWGVAYSAIDNLTLHTGGGDSLFSIESSDAALTIQAGDGADQFIVTRFGDLSEIGADLTLNGEGGDADSLHLYDDHDEAETFTITGSTVARTATDYVTTYGSVEAVILDAGDGDNIFDINGTSRNAPLTINAGSGSDAFHVNAPPSSELTLNGGLPLVDPGDTLSITGRDGEGLYEPGELAGSGTVTVDGQTIQFTGLEPIAVSGFADFTMRTPGVTDELAIASPAPCVTRISGTSSGVAFESLAWFDVDRFVLDTGRGNDIIDIQDAPCSSQAGNDPEEFLVEAGEGDDVVRLAWTDASPDLPGRLLTINGGASFTGDRLTIDQGVLGDQVTYRPGLEPGTGAIDLGSRRRAVLEGIEVVQSRTAGTDVPPAPSLALTPLSDSGVPGIPESFSDRITNVARPIFHGSAEANATVRVYATNAAGAPVLLGETVAQPLTSGLIEAPWSLTSTIDLSGTPFPSGPVRITATASDSAGNESPPATLDILIDVQGPIVRAVERTDGVNVIDQETVGPTPLIAALDITFFDAGMLQPPGSPFFHPAVVDNWAKDPNNYLLVGERVGPVSIESAEIIATGEGSIGGIGFGSDRSGAVIIDGSDRDEHGARTSSANVGGWKWIERIVDFAYAAASSAGVGILVIGASGRAGEAISSVASVLGVPATYVTASQIAAVDFAQFKLVYVPSDSKSIPGGISDADLALLSTRRSDVETFVNNGGSLVALTESEAAAPYQWLGLPNPGGIIDSGSSTERLYQTPALADAGLTISDADLNLGVPWHHHFNGSSGSAGLVPFARSVGPDGIAGNGDDHTVTLGLPPHAGSATPATPGQTTTVRLNFARPLADDQFLLIASAGITDWAGNPLFHRPAAPPPPTEQLSGTSPLPFVCDAFGCHWTNSPLSPILVPCGIAPFSTDCGVSVGSFRVDARPEIGTFYQGSWYIDLNGNGIFDPSSGDANNHDVVWKFGQMGDQPVVGDWDDDGFDEIGVFGMRGNIPTFELDVNGNGTFDPTHGDVTFEVDPLLVGGIRQAVAGNFNPAVAGDELALLRADTWLIDLNGNHQFADPGETILTSFRGQPLAGNWGDFLGQGIDHLASYHDGTFQFDMDGDFQFIPAQDLIEINFQFPGGSPAIAVTGDWDADGNDNIGIFVVDREGVVPREAAEWYLDLGHPDDNVFPGDGLFQPPPMGRPGVPADQQDIFYQFGDGLALPVVGNFDPPPRGVASGQTQSDSQGSIELVLQPPVAAPPLSGDDYANRAGPRATRLTWDELGQAVVDGAVETRGDKDVFELTAPTTARIAIDLTTPFSNLDTRLSLLNSSRRKMARNDDFGSGTDSHIEFDAVAGQTYYVVAEGKRRGLGRYELSLDYLLVGDARPTTVLPREESLRMAGEISDPGAAVFYRFTPKSTASLEIRAGGPVDSVLDIYSSAGYTLAHNDNVTTGETGSRVALDVTAGQPYFIRIRSRSDSTAQYELVLDWLLEHNLSIA